jgi:hypothetical protein
MGQRKCSTKIILLEKLLTSIQLTEYFDNNIKMQKRQNLEKRYFVYLRVQEIIRLKIETIITKIYEWGRE